MSPTSRIGLQKIKIILPMIFFHICAIFPHPPLSLGARVSLPMIGNSVVGDGVPDVPNRLAKNQDNFPMICFQIYNIYPHPPLSRRARVFLPMMDNSVVGDGVPDVPYWLAKYKNIFTEYLTSNLRDFPSP